MTSKRFLVDIFEYEKGWGSRLDERLSFNSKEEAEQFVLDYNSRYNPPGRAPNWYMFAILVN